jgi:hypothetical protein
MAVMGNSKSIGFALKQWRRIRVWYRIRRLAMTGRKVIKVCGLLRTGTNYMERLLTENFDVVCLGDTEGGWKHGPCNFKTYIYYVFVVKNPYSWVKSFMEWEKIHSRIGDKELREFIESAVSHPELRDAWCVDNPVDAWNRTLDSWSRYQGRKNVLFVRYEDLIESFEAQMSSIRERFSLDMKSDNFVNITSRADGWETPVPRKSLDIDYYRNRKYLEEYTNQELELIKRLLDDRITRRFGYEI